MDLLSAFPTSTLSPSLDYYSPTSWSSPSSPFSVTVEDTSNLESYTSESSMPQREAQSSSTDLSMRQIPDIQAPSLDMLPSFEIDWPSSAANGLSVNNVGREEHDRLAMQVQKLETRTAELHQKNRKHKKQRQTAFRKTRRRFRVTKRNLRDLSDLLREMQYWRHALNNALYPVLEQRLELGDEHECENIKDLLEIADDDYAEL